MSSRHVPTTATPARQPHRPLAWWLERHPEWWLYLLGALGWAVLAVHGAVLLGDRHSAVHAGDAAPLHHGSSSVDRAEADVAMFAVMTVAMAASMLPLIAQNARAAALRSPRARRTGAVWDIAASWAAVWLLALAGVGAYLELAVGGLGRRAVVVGTLVAASMWQLTAWRRRHLVGCHRIVLPPLDVRTARRKCRRHGVRLGVDCWMTCGLMMAVMAATGHALVLAVPTFGVAWWERRRVAHHQRRAGSGVVVMVAAAALWLSVDASWLRSATL